MRWWGSVYTVFMKIDKSYSNNKLKKYREALGIERTELSKCIQVTPEKIEAWEKGTAVPPIEQYLKLEILFNADLYDLYPATMKKFVKEFKQAAKSHLTAKRKET